MPTRRFPALLAALIAAFSLSLGAAQKEKKEPGAKEPPKPSYELPQPERETLDYSAYDQIRQEAIGHSHVMEYATALMDGIGPRLTGSPNLKKANEWTRDQLTAMGCSNAHLEDWGEFGMAWEQENTWVRMTSPDKAVFIAQAAPWSPASKGAVSARAVWADIKEEKDFDSYKGKLSGKIVLLGEMREVKPVEKPLFTCYDDTELKKIEQYPIRPANFQAFLQRYMKRMEFQQKLGQFLANEGVLAVILPSRDGENGGGSGGTIFDDNGSGFGPRPYQHEQMNPLPVAVTAIENYGRAYRLLKANVPVTLETQYRDEIRR
jgi:carboxypeptidase Q